MNAPFITKELCAILGNPVAAQYATATGLFPLTLEEFKTIGSKILDLESIEFNENGQRFTAKNKPDAVVKFRRMVHRTDDAWVETDFLDTHPHNLNNIPTRITTYRDGRVLPEREDSKTSVKIVHGVQHESTVWDNCHTKSSSIGDMLLRLEHSSKMHTSTEVFSCTPANFVTMYWCPKYTLIIDLDNRGYPLSISKVNGKKSALKASFTNIVDLEGRLWRVTKYDGKKEEVIVDFSGVYALRGIENPNERDPQRNPVKES